jgi:transcriptional regulator with XRE-family HTH domain
MSIQKAFGQALRTTRKASNLSQEDFSDVSSRTYMSSLERGLKSPTLDKVKLLAGRMGVHPLTLLTITYLFESNQTDAKHIFSQVLSEIDNIQKIKDQT